MRASPASLAVEEGETRLRARLGLAMYLAVLVPCKEPCPLLPRGEPERYPHF